MGYSVTTHAKNKELLLRMWEFMLKHYVEPSKVFGTKNNYSRLAINIKKECESGLSYDHARLAIGFDYNACEPEWDYIFLVVRWMTLKIGQTKLIKNVGEVPFYVYDGYEKRPVFVKNIWKDKIPEKYKSSAVNKVGFRSLSEKFIGCPAYDEAKNKKEWINKHLEAYAELIEIPWQKVDDKIHQELKKLDAKWAKELI
jgi:hypothetical protein